MGAVSTRRALRLLDRFVVRLLATCSLGGSGHWLPLAGFLRAAMQPGDEVVVIAPPALREMVEHDGFRFRAGAEPPEAAIAPIRERLPTEHPDAAAVLGNRVLFAELAAGAMCRTSMPSAPMGTPRVGAGPVRVRRGDRCGEAVDPIGPGRHLPGHRRVEFTRHRVAGARTTPSRPHRRDRCSALPEPVPRPARSVGVSGDTSISDVARRAPPSHCPTGGASAPPRRPHRDARHWCISRSAPCCPTCRSPPTPTASRSQHCRRLDARVLLTVGRNFPVDQLGPLPAERTRRTLGRAGSRPPRRCGRRVPRWIRHAPGCHRGSGPARGDAVLLRSAFERPAGRSPPAGDGGRPDRLAGRSAADVRPGGCTTTRRRGRGASRPPRPSRRNLHGQRLVDRHLHPGGDPRRHVTIGV